MRETEVLKKVSGYWAGTRCRVGTHFMPTLYLFVSEFVSFHRATTTTMTTTYLVILCSLLVCSYAQILSLPLMKRMSIPPTTLQYLSKRTIYNDSPLVYMYGAINTTLEYFMAIEIGSQRQMFAVQIDTGSTSTAIPGIGCMLTNSSGLETVGFIF